MQPSAASETNAAFEAHAAWIRSMRELQASQSDAQPESNRDFLRELDTQDEPQHHATSWQADVSSGGVQHRGERGYDMGYGIDRSFDSEAFEEPPVYRGLNLAAYDIGEPDQEVGHEPPVYRSIAGFQDGGDESEDDGMDAPFSMPPLVQRQRAGQLAVGFEFNGFS